MFGFGGSGSSKDNNSTSPSSSSPSDSTQFSITSPVSPSPSTSSSDTLTRLQSAISQQTAVANARLLISKVNEHCFAHCITTPSSALSSGEKSCLSNCMEKYLDAWNVTNRTYLSRLSKDIPAAAGQAPAGKELF